MHLNLNFIIFLITTIYYYFKKRTYLRCILIPLVKWHITYPLNRSQLEYLAATRGIKIKLSNSTINSVMRIINFKKIEFPLSRPWLIKNHHIKLNRQWRFIYTIKSGRTILDFIVLDQENLEAAKSFFKQSLSENGIPIEINNYLTDLVKRANYDDTFS